MIGDIGIHFLADPHQVEIGFTFAPTFQRKGYALEAVSRVLDYLFLELKKQKIIAFVDPKNIKSIRLLEKLGFKKGTTLQNSNQSKTESHDDCNPTSSTPGDTLFYSLHSLQ